MQRGGRGTTNPTNSDKAIAKLKSFRFEAR
jgi:hypothetical protein